MKTEFCLSIKKNGKHKTFYASFYYKNPPKHFFSDLYILKESGNKLPHQICLINMILFTIHFL